MIQLDRQLERFVVLHRVEWLDWLFVGLSRIGTLGIVWIALAALVAALIRRPPVLFITVAAVATADLLAFALKTIVAVDRPPERYATPDPLVRVPTDYSFPSGHTATSFAAALILARAVPRRAWLFYALAAAIGFSRIYVGVHYPLDILGGAVLGLLVATALLRLVAALPRSRRATR
ncbi:MAG: phosphatase PAP2 family protein [Actinomycetota bacterium]|nr:phosphatase PAP2 family protein [Actinomycetota bacterium]